MNSQSKIYIFCNQNLVEKPTKAKTKIQINSNGGTITVSHKVTVTVYDNSVWFIKKSITVIIDINNLRLQYPVTYRSN